MTEAFAPGAAGRVLRGVVRCARGRPEGLALFDATPRGFAASLAPLIAFPLVGAAVGIGQEGVGAAALNLAASVCGLLTPPVVSHALARAWGREAGWLRYAVAYNWCRCAIPVLVFAAALAVVILAPALSGLHAGMNEIVGGCVMALIGYWLWLHWFLARHGLGLSRGRAALLVLVVDGCTGAILALPRLIG